MVYSVMLPQVVQGEKQEVGAGVTICRTVLRLQLQKLLAIGVVGGLEVQLDLLMDEGWDIDSEDIGPLCHVG